MNERLVRVVFADPQSGFDVWSDVDECEGLEPALCVAVGHSLFENSERIVIALVTSRVDEHSQARQCISIPKDCIINIAELSAL